MRASGGGTVRCCAKSTQSTGGGVGAGQESGSSGMGTENGWTKGETFFQGFPRGCCFEHPVRRLPSSFGHCEIVRCMAGGVGV